MDAEKVKSALKLFIEAFKSTEQKFKDAKLNDGTTVISYEADKLDVGVAVMAVTESGKLPLPDGDYTLEDGTMFNVANGMVTAVTEGEAPKEEEAPKAEANMGAPATQGNQIPKSIVESVIKESRFQEQIDELKTTIDGFKTASESFATQKESDKKEIEDLKLELKASNEKLLKAVELMEQSLDIPSTPATESKKPFNIAEFRRAYKEDLQNLKPKDKTN